jgi:hypothetical protein
MSAVMISDHFQHERTDVVSTLHREKKAARGTMKSQRMRLAMRGTVLFGRCVQLIVATL